MPYRKGNGATPFMGLHRSLYLIFLPGWRVSGRLLLQLVEGIEDITHDELAGALCVTGGFAECGRRLRCGLLGALQIKKTAKGGLFNYSAVKEMASV